MDGIVSIFLITSILLGSSLITIGMASCFFAKSINVILVTYGIIAGKSSNLIILYCESKHVSEKIRKREMYIIYRGYTL
jgi:hypothetical protein